MDNRLIARKMIETAIKFDESLVEILKVEVKRLKQLAKSNSNSDIEELQKTNRLIKNIIIALSITDEKIKTGIDFYMSESE
jgi:hypothetical protein